MPYDSLTGRTEADILIPVGSATEIIKLVTEESAALRLMRTVRMSSKLFAARVLRAPDGVLTRIDRRSQGLSRRRPELAAADPGIKKIGGWASAFAFSRGPAGLSIRWRRDRALRAKSDRRGHVVEARGHLDPVNDPTGKPPRDIEAIGRPANVQRHRLIRRG
jgi:hypothetical protein